MLSRIVKQWSKYGVIPALAVLLLTLVQAAPALAAGPGDRPTPPAVHPILGVVPPRGQASRFAPIGGNLIYHNGPTMNTNTTYAIYWVPSGFTVSANYMSLINGFLQNVHADNGKSSNVYYSDTQYYDNTSGAILYDSTFGASWTDTSALPASGCSDSYTSVCLSDAQIQAEVQKAITTNGWTAGPTHLFFLYTAKGIGSCAGSSCAFTQYCAYHSWIGSGSNVTLYANMPYADTVPSACDAGQHPNNDDADATINVASHEHNEAITDELGSAWYDRRGYENGDKCAWKFGTALGSTGGAGTEYNQVIGTGKYWLQQEWSNKSSKCVLTGI